MEITKRGSVPAARIWHGTCKSCESEATATQAELAQILTDPRDGSKLAWERCPVCGAGSGPSAYGGMLFYPAVQ